MKRGDEGRKMSGEGEGKKIYKININVKNLMFKINN